jgi:magnesium transporter
MISYWQQENGKLIKKNEHELDAKHNTWIDARLVTSDDVHTLEEKYHIDPENVLDILDPDELSRIEKNDETGYIVTIVRLPVFTPSDDISYYTAPLGIIIQGNNIITICWTDSDVLRDFAANRVPELSLKDFTAFTIRFMSRADFTFLRYLKELNRRSTTIQNEMFRAVENREFIQLLNIQKSLVYFSTSLKSNQMLLEKLRKTRVLKLDEEDQDWLDDVEIDNRQAMEMADTYTNIMSQMNEAFGAVLSNNLNIVMKKMTLISLVLMIPTFITSFFGMNIPLPWMHSGWKGMVTIIILCILSALIGWYFIMGSTNAASQMTHHKKSFKQIHAESKQKQFIKKQERLAAKQGTAESGKKTAMHKSGGKK